MAKGKMFTGKVIKDFIRKGKLHVAGTEFKTINEFTFNYLINTKRIKE